jgi:hypothetical protein
LDVAPVAAAAHVVDAAVPVAGEAVPAAALDVAPVAAADAAAIEP